MQNLIDFASDNAKTGFRLHKMEVLNWGTFNKKSWKIAPHGSNSLLTGDIGSGKSTLVDAITTLLVPHHKITYNKAAGAESKERTIYSYLRGEYKNEKDELTHASKKVYLRDENSFSVLLANFQNAGYDSSVSIAQVFWLKNDKPEKFFVIADLELNLKDHFSNFGEDIAALKRNLKKMVHVEIYEHFKIYGAAFCQKFGIKSENALELFYQTVSMKSIGNLTDFVRNQMLEKSDVKDKIEELIKNFDNLTQAHESVQKAKKQLLQLNPLIEDANAYDKIYLNIENLRKSLEALPVFFSIKKVDLLKTEIETVNKELTLTEEQLTKIANDLEELREKESKIKSAIDNDKEGQRISEIEGAVKHLEVEQAKKSAQHTLYSNLCQKLDLPDASNEADFFQNLDKIQKLQKNTEEEQNNTILERDQLKIEINDLQKNRDTEHFELESLRKRRTQIPNANLNIRRRLLDDLELEENELPFLGELIKVKEGEHEWEGAIERLLHNFGLSILVAEDNYKRVSHYINKTDLKGRVVYYRAGDQSVFRKSGEIDHNSLLNKLEIKSDTSFYYWIEQELNKRFNLTCCNTLEAFYREPNAITREGQIKSGQYRHEKDDRRNIFDKRNYILGWTNKDKIEAVEQELQKLEEKLTGKTKALQSIDKIQQKLKDKERDTHDLLKFTTYEEIHWQKYTKQIQELLNEKHTLEQSSDKLQALRAQLETTKKSIKVISEKQLEKQARKGGLTVKVEGYSHHLKNAEQYVNLLSPEEKAQYFPHIEKRMPVFESSLQNIDNLQDEVRKKFDTKISSQSEVERKLSINLVKKMQVYKNEYSAETVEVDASMDAIPEFRKLGQKLKNDDLPKHEQRFKKLLNEGTIQGILIFKNQLEQFEQDIRDKIKKINESLVEIEYDPGTFIKLNDDRNPDKDINQFKIDLRHCLENTLGETDHYNEDKFLQVKQILDRFKGGDNRDIAWTQRVTDVRNWFMFSADVIWTIDGTEKEHITDSSGKSGGQKEKLAYTILASALAYQFGLEWGSSKSRSFRFVVIDEAFGRGSDESTRYGLKLFDKLNLQLLIVTPLQKINIIEDYINYVHFVSNLNGQNSVVRDLSKAEYVQEKAEYLKQFAIKV